MSSSIKDISLHVRVSQDQYERLSRESLLLGKSKPSLLRDVYFKGPHISPFFDALTVKEMYRIMSKAGVNINQIAKKVNSGIAAGFYDELINSIHQKLTQIMEILATNGNRKVSTL